MERLFVILAAVLAITSCQFTQNSGQAGRLHSHAEEAAWELDDAAPAANEETPVVAEETLQAVNWYEMDFCITVIKHVYTGTRLNASMDVTNTFTRLGNIIYVDAAHKDGSKASNKLVFKDDGTYDCTNYVNGRVLETFTEKGTPKQYLEYQFRRGMHPVLTSHPDQDNDGENGTICGRPCRIIEKVSETTILGNTTRSEEIYYIDKEYDFVYKILKSASGQVNMNNMCPWEVTKFTDQPTTKDIPFTINK